MTNSTVSFVHLRTYSDYSIHRGLAKVDRLAHQTAALDMPALALSDCGNLFGAVKFHLACLQHGVKPLIAVDFAVYAEQRDSEPTDLLLLACNQQGYHNLLELVTKCSREPHTRYGPVLRESWLRQHNDGLLALSGGRRGAIGSALLAARPELAKSLLCTYSSWFAGTFYLEVQRLGREDDQHCLHKTLELAITENVPVVATNAVCFLARSDFEAHEARTCIHSGHRLSDPRRPHDHTSEQYLKSPEEMCALFTDLPELITNSVEIARRCNFSLQLGQVRMPKFRLQRGETEGAYLARASRAGLTARLDHHFPEIQERERQQATYSKRLETELEIINDMGFSGYFLIVMEFIQWAKNEGIPVGPGRGSGAGSLAAYALGITDIDPIRYDLLFERFLNPERVSPPDIDVDFCMDGRDRVIQHVAAVYGTESVSQIATFGVMAAKAVVRDVARVQGKPYMLGDRLARLIPNELNITLAKALRDEALNSFVATDVDAREVMDMALRLEGVIRNLGKHAGGVVIAPGRLPDFVPLINDESGALMTQFDKDDVEKIGLVKFDFLGLRTLTVIDSAMQTINADRVAAGNPPLAIATIPLDDQEVFKLLKTGTTTAIFQLESSGMRSLIRRLQPDSFEDIIALVALFRPGPLQSGMVDDYIERKHGKAKISYPHAKLEALLKETYGVILYQEQVMRIAQLLAGYSLSEADLLRRAMGKKKAEEMAEHRESFMRGATQSGVAKHTATHIFDLMEKFAGYGFNKSHSAAYAMVSYQTAWLKQHYPAAFMAAVLSVEMQHTDKLGGLVTECRRMSLVIQGPDVNRSSYAFTVGAQDLILYGLGAIKGLGQAIVQEIIRARKDDDYEDLFDFCARIGPRHANKRALESLVYAGALDLLPGTPKLPSGEPHRAALYASVEEAAKYAEQMADNDRQPDLLSELCVPLLHAVKTRQHAVRGWTVGQRLAKEMIALGFYLSGHPLEEYAAEAAALRPHRISALSANQSTTTLFGIVSSLREKRTLKGEKLTFMQLDDGSGTIDILIGGQHWAENVERLAVHQVVLVRAEISGTYDGGLKLRAQEICSLPEARSRLPDGLWISLSADACDVHTLDHLAKLLTQHKGNGCDVSVHYSTQGVEACLPLGSANRVNPTDALIEELRACRGVSALSWRRPTQAVTRAKDG